MRTTSSRHKLLQRASLSPGEYVHAQARTERHVTSPYVVETTRHRNPPKHPETPGSNDADASNGHEMRTHPRECHHHHHHPAGRATTTVIIATESDDDHRKRERESGSASDDQRDCSRCVESNHRAPHRTGARDGPACSREYANILDLSFVPLYKQRSCAYRVSYNFVSAK